MPIDSSPDTMEQWVDGARDGVRKYADGELKRMAEEKQAKQPAANDEERPTDPVEILRTSIADGIPPIDTKTTTAFRFDRAYQIKDKSALLDLYRVLVLDLNLDPKDMQQWIEDDTFVGRLVILQKEHAETDEPDTNVKAKLDWLVKNKYIFGALGTTEDYDALTEAVKAVPSSDSFGQVARDAAAMTEIMQADMDAAAARGELLAYIITRPLMDNHIQMLYSHGRGRGPPNVVKTIRLDKKAQMSIVREGQSYEDAIAWAEKDYLEAQEFREKKKREEAAAAGSSSK